MKRIWIACLVLLLPALARAAPVAATITQLIHDPERFAFKAVRVTGDIRFCDGNGCVLCPTGLSVGGAVGGPDQTCLGMRLSGFDGDAEKREGPVSDAARRTAALMAAAFGNTNATLVGYFNPACMTRFAAVEMKKHGTVVVCADRETDLFDARIETVHARNVPRGDDMAKDTLTPPPEGERKAMQAALATVRLPSGDTSLFVIAGMEFGADIQTVGLVCVCREARCEGRWPRHRMEAWDNVANPYDCFSMTKTGGRWLFEPR